MTPTTETKGRISMRVNPKVDEALRCAADVEHKTLTSFVLDAAWSHAQVVLRDQNRLGVQAEEFARILDELDRPAEVVSPLLQAAMRAAREDAAVVEAV